MNKENDRKKPQEKKSRERKMDIDDTERCYAVLQAAATIYGTAGKRSMGGQLGRITSAVGEAEALLAEIERRARGEVEEEPQEEPEEKTA
jgi:hypothetical protein